MGKLKVECFEKRLQLGKLLDAVYSVLKQTDNLKAELLFYNSFDMQALNRETRNIDKVTDVLSYPTLDGIKGEILKKKDHFDLVEDGHILIGSIVLCEEKIKKQAKEYGNTYVQERNYLIIHGLLHLLGYDHIEERDKIEMRSKEKEILKILGRED